MKKSAKILVIAALVVSAVVMTSCSNLLSAITGKPNGTYVYETYYDSGDLKTRDVYTFTGSKFKNESYSWLLGGFDEPWITITGSFTVDGDKATLTEENTGLNVKIEITTDDKWKTFTSSSGNLYKKKSL